jgi:hypothetical protein
MTGKNYLAPLAGKKILVAPLDWGLGHATRCVPLIKALYEIHCELWLAGEGAQEDLLRKEFPALPFLPLKGYRIQYGKRNLTGNLLMQIPSILRSIKVENRWLKDQVAKHNFDSVISDNRYGLYHEKIFSVFITHQLRIKSPYGRWSENLLQLWNYNFINRFNECWVPDDAGEKNLAGELSHPEKMPAVTVNYIGPLSRFVRHDLFGEKKGHLLFILSGPEPQRTLFEEKIIEQVSHYTGTVTVIRGLPLSEKIIPSTEQVIFYNHLPAKYLNEEIGKAEFIISRSGYSTVMDIAALQKKSLLIPTPGQPEQEYLATYLMKKQFSYCVKQDDFSLLKNLKEAEGFQYKL